MTFTSHPSNAKDKPLGFESLPLRKRYRKPAAFDSAFSVLSIFPSDTLLSTGNDDVASYEEAAAEAWQRVGDSMRAALNLGCSPRETP